MLLKSADDRKGHLLRYIIKKEILEIITGPKFLFTFALCAILILLSVYTGTVNYLSASREYTASVELNMRNLEAQPNYGGVATFGAPVGRPPQVLGTIVSGIEDSVGRVTNVNTATDPRLTESKYESNPTFAVFGPLDLMFIVKMVLSLFAVLFTYDAIAGEKERGTLRLALANSLPRDQWLLGKVIGGYLSLLIPLIIPFILSLVALAIVPDLAFSGGDWERLLLIFLLFLVYLTLFFSLGVFVSARTSRSSTSFLVLLFVWVVFVMVVPKVAVIAADRIDPVPSVHEIKAEKDAFLRQMQAEASATWEKWNKDHEGLYDKDREAFQKEYLEFIAKNQEALVAKLDAGYSNIEGDYQNRLRSQQALALNLSRISPASSLSFGAMTLAGTGVSDYERFMSSLRTYRIAFTKWVLSKLSQTRGKPSAKPGISLEGMPRHSYEPESLGESLARTIPDFGLMLVMIVVFFGGAYISFRRYDVR